MEQEMDFEAMAREHEELMNAIEIIAETSSTIEEFLAKFRRLRENEKEDSHSTK